MKRTLVFDWGNTIMVDFGYPGPMTTWDKVAWEPGAEKALKDLSLNYPCCIASNAPDSDTVEMINALKRVGADAYFTWFFTSREIGFEKPDIRFFQAICKRMDILPEHCIMIGDNYVKDITGAKTAGMKSVFYNRRKMDQPFPDADVVIVGMDELTAVIETI